jgi:hypothetical protein
MTRRSLCIGLAALAAVSAAPAAAEARAETLARSVALGFPASPAGEAACFGRLSRAMIETGGPDAGAEALSRAVAAVGHVCERVHVRRGAMEAACDLAAVLRGRPAAEICDEIEPRAALWWAEIVAARPEATAALTR